MDSKVPQEIQEQILNLKAQSYSKGSIVREVKKITKNKELATEYVDSMLNVRKQVLRENPQLYQKRAKQQFYIGLAFIVIPITLVLLFPDFLQLRLGIIVGPIYLLLSLGNYLKSLRKTS